MILIFRSSCYDQFYDVGTHLYILMDPYFRMSSANIQAGSSCAPAHNLVSSRRVRLNYFPHEPIVTFGNFVYYIYSCYTQNVQKLVLPPYH